ncbi:hypothetical protein [Natronomonas sp. EA1]|uniref:hypothetical protein n=1 Tax=Natronomonas sp. EA1 TaxID=3421655 RepID=UPI003EBE76F0
MLETLAKMNRELTQQQKVQAGVAGIVIGSLLIAMLAFASLESSTLQFILALMGVVMMVAGTLSLGTSGVRDGPVV